MSWLNNGYSQADELEFGGYGTTRGGSDWRKRLDEEHQDNMQQVSSTKVTGSANEQIDFSLKVTDELVTVNCKCPGLSFAVEGSMELVGPYIEEALKKLKTQLEKK